jgi:hypothetical protein
MLDPNITIDDAFLSPLTAALAKASNTRDCPELSDTEYLKLVVARTLSDARSGRGFLQQFAAKLLGDNAPGHSGYFQLQHSARRLSVLTEVGAAVAAGIGPIGRFDEALANYDIYAGDGHWHAAAARDPAIDDRKWAVGHLYGLNLRTRAMHHLDVTLGKHEHDMSVIKRLGAERFRMGARKRRKVIWVWDRAGLNSELWLHWKRTSGIYFISRSKDGMVLDAITCQLVDRDNKINRGIITDSLVLTAEGLKLRLVQYRNPLDGNLYEFLTSVFDVAPGLIAWLYLRRWDIEKVFDQFKNKLFEAKAWGSSENARLTQAEALCLTHNLLEHFERSLDVDHGVRDEAGLRRRDGRLEKRIAAAAKVGRSLSTLLTHAFAAPLQRSIKLLRWLRAHFFDSAPLCQVLPILRASYALL